MTAKTRLCNNCIEREAGFLFLRREGIYKKAIKFKTQKDL